MNSSTNSALVSAARREARRRRTRRAAWAMSLFAWSTLAANSSSVSESGSDGRSGSVCMTSRVAVA